MIKLRYGAALWALLRMLDYFRGGIRWRASFVHQAAATPGLWQNLHLAGVSEPQGKGKTAAQRADQ